jgi:histidinol-phosphatase (PHP family)
MRQLIDMHAHTNFSPDADKDATMAALVEKATRMGLPGVMFTDHVDLESPIDIFQDLIDFDDYMDALEQTRKVSDIPVLFGVEIGYQPFLHKAYDDLLASRPFDFVICSMHVADGLDFYNGDFFKGKTKNQAYRRYFEVLLDAVRAYDNYDVIGHLDFITRYGNHPDKGYAYSTYQDLLDEILMTIIAKGKGIELNTSGLRYGLPFMHPVFETLSRYKELGGTIITLGSDAHSVSDLQAGFPEARERLLLAGFDRVAIFEKRTPRFIRI